MNFSTTSIKILAATIWLLIVSQSLFAERPVQEHLNNLDFSATCDNQHYLSEAMTLLPPPPCILVQNPEFDASLTDWTGIGSVTSTTDAYAGTHAAVLGSFSSRITQYHTGITEGNIYSLSAYAKRAGFTFWTSIGIAFYDASLNLISNNYTSITSSGYELHEVSAIAPAGAIYIEVYASQFGFGQVYVDEFCLEETEIVVGECILMQNSDFEDNLNNWSGSGSVTTSTDAFQGNTAAELISNGTYINQRLSVTPGQVYQLTAYAKISNRDPNYAEIFMDFRDASGSLIETIYQPVLSEVEEYTLFSLIGTAPANAAYADVGAYKTGNSSRRLLVDDFCFSITDPLGGNSFDLTCGCSNNLLPNGGYEYSNISSYPYLIEGIQAAAIPDNDDSSLEPYKTDLSSDYAFYINDSGDAVNNPEGDHFIVMTDNNDEWHANLDFDANLLLQNGQTYSFCLYAAAWTVSLDGNDLPDGGTENQFSAVVNLGLDYDSGYEEVFAWSVPTATSFNNLSWTKLTYTFTYNGTDPISSFVLVNDRNNVGVAIDAVSLTKVGCVPTQECTNNGLNYQRWTGISSPEIRELLWDVDYPNNYDYSGTITDFQGPIGYGDNYGSKAYGYIVPTETGNYTFNVTGDDDILLYLSTDSSFNNKSLIAYVDGWTNITQHTKYSSQTSASIYLEAGEKYYTELLHKEGWGGDHFQVYWKTPSNSSWNIVPNANLKPICYAEICDNGLDDDLDGLIDCADEDCSGESAVTYNVVDENCGSGGGQIDLTVPSVDEPLSYTWSDMPLTAWWTFEGTTDDVSGNLNHANYTSGSLSYSNNAIEGNNVAYFNGSTRIRYSIDNGFMEQQLTEISVSMWIKPDNLSGIRTLFDEGGSTGGRGMAIRLNNDKLSAGVRNGGGTFFIDESHQFPNDGEWHHVAAVFDNGEFTVYLDGVPSTPQITSFTTIEKHGNNGGIGGNFGGSVLNSGSTLYRGYMDDVRYYLVGLDSNQVADIARNDGDRINLFAGSYTVSVYTSSGCSFDESINVNSSANHDDGGIIDGDEISCETTFDPSIISSSAPASGGGSGFTEYQWQLSTDGGLNWTDIPGAVNESFDPTSITTTTIYRRGGRLNPCLAWIYSNEVTKLINTNFTEGGSINGNQGFCNSFDPSQIVDLTAPSGGNGGVIEYQWQLTYDTLSTWTDIAGAKSQDYDPSTISQTTYYRRGARRNPCSDYIYTNIISKIVIDNFTDGGLIAGQEEFCGSYDPDLISSITTPSGGNGGVLTYIWEKSTDGVVWSQIGGSNTETYNPTTVIETTFFRRGARRSPCLNFAYSNTIKKTVVVNFNAGGILDGDQSVCGNYDPFNISSISPPSGGIDGTLTYQWQLSTDDGATWSAIPGEVNEEYDPGIITQTTLFRRQARRAPCTTWINSNSITKERREVPVPVFADSPTEVNGFICEWVGYDFESQDEGAGATYAWDFGSYAIPSSATGKGPHVVTYNVPGSVSSTNVTVELTVFKDGCAGISTKDYDIRPQIVVSDIDVTDPNSCNSSNGSIEVTTINPSGTMVEASIDGGADWKKEPIKFNNLAAGVYELRLRYEDGECEQVWGNVTVTDPGSLSADIVLSTTETCNNTFFSVEAIPSGGGGNPTYSWDFGPSASPVIAYGVGPHTVSYSDGGEKTIELTISENFCTGLVDTAITIVSTYVDGGTLTGDEDLCSVGPAGMMTTGTSPSGGYAGTADYQWEYREDNDLGGWTTWAEISGATSETYTPPYIGKNTQFRRKARRLPCTDWAYSAEVEKRVSGTPQPQPDVYTSACPGFLFYDYVNTNDLNLINPVYSVALLPTNGTLDLDADGEFVYTPNASFCGFDQFTYRVCNNGTTCCSDAVVTIDLADNESPALQNIPADIIISCDDVIPLAPIVDAWENCHNVTLGMDEESNQGELDSCSIYSYNLWRTWTASDYCGNNASEQQIITIEDMTAPDIYRIYTLPNGKKLVAGVMENVSHRWKTIEFPIQFTTKPVVFAQVSTNNDGTTVNTRLRNVSTAQFQIRLQEEENQDDKHASENVSWIAIEEGANMDGLPFEIGSKLLSSSAATINFTDPLLDAGFIATTQTYNENNPISVRINALSSTSANIFLQEETSFDPESNHGFETVGYMALSGSGNIINNDGEVIGEVNRVNVDENIRTISLNHTYHNPVVVLGGVPMTEADEANIRVDNVTANSFDVKIDEWEYKDGLHAAEELTYMVVEGSIPFDQEVECSAIPDIPTIGVDIVGKDNCDVSTPLTVTESHFEFNCENDTLFTRTFYVQDECGNITTMTQVYTLRDTTPPTFSAPADVTITCLTDEHDLINTGDVTNEADNCADDLEATYVDDRSNVTGCFGYIIREWTLFDHCNNIAVDTQYITLFNDNDADGDGIPDPFDIDDDNDGIPDLVEGNDDTDGDGIPDSQDLDSDNDGIPDIIEAGFEDHNGDGIFDTYGDPDWDIDGDGLANEVDGDQNDPDENASVDFDPTSETADVDGDGIPNYIDLDSDNDGIPDIIEAGGVDTNGDGVIDYPDPGNPESMSDSDGDGFVDHYDPDDDSVFGIDNAGDVLVTFEDGEYNGGDESFDPDFDDDGIPNYWDSDSDNDGIADIIESGGIDTNGDGLIDNDEFTDVNNNGFHDEYENSGLIITDPDGSTEDGRPEDDDGDGTAYNGGDNDSDGTPNFIDTDSDNDNINDIIEVGYGNLDVNNDGMLDNFVDVDNNGFNDDSEGTIFTDGEGITEDGLPEDSADIGNSSYGSVLPDGTYGENNGENDIDDDGDGIPNFIDTDSDNDNVNDEYEDTNGNGHTDEGETGWLNTDTDGDLIPDGIEDSNQDGYFDPETETDPTNPDTDNDGLDDGVEDSNQNGTVDGPDESDPTNPCDPLVNPACIGISLDLIVNLGGALIDEPFANEMADKLREGGHLPVEEPYTDLPFFNHVGEGGGEKITDETIFDVDGPSAIVDWIMVELRSPVLPSLVISTKSGLLTKSGRIVATDGVSSIFFNDVPSGSYYVSIKHRNHLGICTQNPLIISPTTTTIDFTDPSMDLWGDYAVGDYYGKQAMWLGDVDGNQNIIFQGPANDVFHILYTVLTHHENDGHLANYVIIGYTPFDVNMDGLTIFQGPKNDKAPILFHSILATEENSYRLANFILSAKLP